MSGFCGQCGAASAAPDQRFCQACGAATTAAVPAAADVQAPAAVDYAVPADVPRRERSASVGRILGSGAAVLAVAAGGLVAWQVLGSSGGAASPEDAVRQFVTAATEQDIVGALDVVNPGEVEGLDSLYEAARDRAEDEGLVGHGDIAEALDVTIDDLELDVDEQGDYSAFVTIRNADYTVTYDPDKLTDRLDFVRDEFPGAREWSGDLTGLLEDEGVDLDRIGISTIKVDGAWYVSVIGTSLDSVVHEASANDDRSYIPSSSDYDAIGEDLEPIVGKDPDEALTNIADALYDQDVEQVLANFPADQVRAMRPYVEVAEDFLADWGVSLDGGISDLDLETEDLSGDLVKVVIDDGTGSVSITDDYGTSSGEGTIDGRCLEGTSYESYDGYDDVDEGRVCLDGDVVDYSGIDELYVVMRKVDGGYQLDPLATAVEYASRAVEAVPSSAIDEALGEICYEVQGYDETGCPS